MKKRSLLTAVGAIVALAVPATAAQASVWHTVVTKTERGAFSIGSFYRTVNHPIALRLKANTSSGRANVVWSVSCSKGWNFRSKSGTWRPGAGQQVMSLPMGFTNPETCDVVASLSPSIYGGSVTVALQKR